MYMSSKISKESVLEHNQTYQHCFVLHGRRHLETKSMDSTTPLTPLGLRVDTDLKMSS